MTLDAIVAAMAQVPFPAPEKPRLANPTRTNLRRVGQFSLTDAVLLHRALSTEAKVVLGYSINYPNLDPSLTTLEKVARLGKRAVIAAQNELEERASSLTTGPSISTTAAPPKIPVLTVRTASTPSTRSQIRSDLRTRARPQASRPRSSVSFLARARTQATSRSSFSSSSGSSCAGELSTCPETSSARTSD